METSVQQCIMHGAGCILIFEYSYFHLPANTGQRDIIALAVKEYQESSTQNTVVEALQHTIQEHNEDHITLHQTIVDIIVKNRMSNKFKLTQQLATQA
ncbi:hypothetical protein SCLCIDRAFT_1212045 [Scleroderma citrinum Foug A]|uniref:Uncharacterized protein n=1 Tax=Scleroderma citrinum Foug A TaxID=1036808 RepID=A0A0C3AL44_9AGAM|nr:hypothetical protein SCLCIDRAFT_1212045 [Scleroderma citrinum Foug A]